MTGLFASLVRRTRVDMSGDARRVGRWAARLVVLAGLMMSPAMAGHAQSVVVDVPGGASFTSITPLLTVRTAQLGPERPLLVNVQLSATPDFTQLVYDTAFTKTDTVFSVQLTRPLSSGSSLYVRALARAFSGPLTASAVVGPRVVPEWLRLITPNSASGDGFNIRRPLLVWTSAPVFSALGPWQYDVEVTAAGRPEVAVAGLQDTTWRPLVDLQANTSYRWSVRASLKSGESIRVQSAGSFVITDPPLPTITVLYQNFPNPFPSATAFQTCFWFDIGASGASVQMDILDLRGTQVRRIVPGPDRVSEFAPGRYGRGLVGSESNCDNRFVWDGLAEDGRVVAPGVYLVRFRAGTDAPIFRRIVFRGR